MHLVLKFRGPHHLEPQVYHLVARPVAPFKLFHRPSQPFSPSSGRRTAYAVDLQAFGGYTLRFKAQTASRFQ